MPKRVPKTNQAKKSLKKSGDFTLNKRYYKQLRDFKIFESEKRIAKIFGVKNKKTGEEFINIKSKSFKPFNRGWKFNFGVSLYDTSHINSLFQGLRVVAKKMGWKEPKAIKNIEELRSQLRKKEEAIISLESASDEERAQHQDLMSDLKKLQKEVFKSKQQNFESDLEELRKMIEQASVKKSSENKLQQFLYDHTWLFGTEYINAEPQKLRGVKNRFDFYLERFNKTRDIVEIKLLSDAIINKDKSISAKVIQAVDQAIGYMESSIAAAHSSVISEEEGIRELRPRAIVIIGHDNSKDAMKKLHMWNYQFAHITILTYFDIAARADAVLRHIKSQN